MAEFEPLETLQHGPFHAWKMNIPARLAAEGFNPDSDACVASWIVQAPWAHPAWNSYWIMIMHLRPLVRDGKSFQPPIINLPGATHELHVHALNPDHKAEIMARACDVYRLTPANFVSQLILSDDFRADQVARETVTDVLQGRLNPDTDAVGQWAARFGDNMLKRKTRW